MNEATDPLAGYGGAERKMIEDEARAIYEASNRGFPTQAEWSAVADGSLRKRSTRQAAVGVLTRHDKLQPLSLAQKGATVNEQKAEQPIGWVKSNGAGEVIFRQAGYPANDVGLPADGWRPVGIVESPPAPPAVPGLAEAEEIARGALTIPDDADYVVLGGRQGVCIRSKFAEMDADDLRRVAVDYLAAHLAPLIAGRDARHAAELARWQASNQDLIKLHNDLLSQWEASSKGLKAEMAKVRGELETATAKVAVAERYGLKFGIMKESGKAPYWTFEPADGSECEKADKSLLREIGDDASLNAALAENTRACAEAAVQHLFPGSCRDRVFAAVLAAGAKGGA